MKDILRRIAIGTQEHKGMKKSKKPGKANTTVAKQDYEVLSAHQQREAIAADLKVIRRQQKIIVDGTKDAYNSLVDIVNAMRLQGESLIRIMGGQMNFDFIVPIQTELPTEWKEKAKIASQRIALAKQYPEPVKEYDELSVDARKSILAQLELTGPKGLLTDGDTTAPPKPIFTTMLGDILKTKQTLIKAKGGMSWPDLGEDRAREFWASTAYLREEMRAVADAFGFKY
jgi:hypothetical protein